MSTHAADTSVHASIDVQAPIERAFQVFTADMGSWWPPDHHILEGELEQMVFEPHVGGHVYDRAKDGSECRWARVLAYEPPHRFVFSWDVSTDWKLETDPTKTSEVEVTFTPEGPDRTHVEVEHRNLDRHGKGWEQMRDAVGSEGGWQRGMVAFADRLAR